MSAKRRKYEFNVIDYLWYMGKDSWRVPLSRWPTPFESIVWSVVLWTALFLGTIFVVLSPEYAESIIVTFLIAGFIACFRYEAYLEKHRFTPLREKAYFRRYPERRHYSRWVLFFIPVIVLLLSSAIFGSVLVMLIKNIEP